jgi:hypothetical protein
MSTQAKIDNMLAIIAEKLGSGMGDLLGCAIEVEPASSGMIAKGDFFDQFRKKLVMVDVEVTGAYAEHLFLFSHLMDAVLLGGTLIMLPPAELEKKVRKEDFTEDEEDAFGEITNILTGELGQAFDEGFGEDLHFRKNGQQVVMPARVSADESDPVPPGEYFRVSLSLNFDGQKLQNLEILFPPVLFGLAQKPIEKPAPATPSPEPPAEQAEVEEERPLLLIVAAGEDGGDLAGNCTAEGFAVRTVGCQDDFQVVARPGETAVRGVLLQMDASKEQGLAAIIKARSVFGEAIPLIALGAQWTRSQVLQAARYGVCDIVVTPAVPQDLREKLRRHFPPEG